MIFTNDPAVLLHSANLLMGVVVFIWMLVRTTRRWGEYPSEMQLLLTASLAVLFALLVVSAEQLLAHRDISADTFVITFVKLYVLFYLFRTRKTLFRTGTRHQGEGHNGDETDVDRDYQEDIDYDA